MDKTILVVEDQEDNRRILRDLLTSRGFTIIEVTDGLAGVEFVCGDFTEDDVFTRIVAALDGAPVDLVISDMAPNMSGMQAVDQPRSIHLVELALDMAQQVLAPNGAFIAKIFQGDGFEQVFQVARSSFLKVLTRKPSASRPRSREVYMVAKGFRGP